MFPITLNSVNINEQVSSQVHLYNNNKNITSSNDHLNLFSPNAFKMMNKNISFTDRGSNNPLDVNHNVGFVIAVPVSSLTMNNLKSSSSSFSAINAKNNNIRKSSSILTDELFCKCMRSSSTAAASSNLFGVPFFSKVVIFSKLNMNIMNNNKGTFNNSRSFIPRIYMYLYLSSSANSSSAAPKLMDNKIELFSLKQKPRTNPKTSLIVTELANDASMLSSFAQNDSNPSVSLSHPSLPVTRVYSTATAAIPKQPLSLPIASLQYQHVKPAISSSPSVPTHILGDCSNCASSSSSSHLFISSIPVCDCISSKGISLMPSTGSGIYLPRSSELVDSKVETNKKNTGRESDRFFSIFSDVSVSSVVALPLVISPLVKSNLKQDNHIKATRQCVFCGIEGAPEQSSDNDNNSPPVCMCCMINLLADMEIRDSFTCRVALTSLPPATSGVQHSTASAFSSMKDACVASVPSTHLEEFGILQPADWIEAHMQSCTTCLSRKYTVDRRPIASTLSYGAFAVHNKQINSSNLNSFQKNPNSPNCRQSAILPDISVGSLNEYYSEDNNDEDFCGSGALATPVSARHRMLDINTSSLQIELKDNSPKNMNKKDIKIPSLIFSELVKTNSGSYSGFEMNMESSPDEDEMETFLQNGDAAVSTDNDVISTSSFNHHNILNVMYRQHKLPKYNVIYQSMYKGNESVRLSSFIYSSNTKDDDDVYKSLNKTPERVQNFFHKADDDKRQNRNNPVIEIPSDIQKDSTTTLGKFINRFEQPPCPIQVASFENVIIYLPHPSVVKSSVVPKLSDRYLTIESLDARIQSKMMSKRIPLDSKIEKLMDSISGRISNNHTPTSSRIGSRRFFSHSNSHSSRRREMSAKGSISAAHKKVTNTMVNQQIEAGTNASDGKVVEESFGNFHQYFEAAQSVQQNRRLLLSPSFHFEDKENFFDQYGIVNNENSLNNNHKNEFLFQGDELDSSEENNSPSFIIDDDTNDLK